MWNEFFGLFTQSSTWSLMVSFRRDKEAAWSFMKHIEVLKNSTVRLLKSSDAFHVVETLVIYLHIS